MGLENGVSPVDQEREGKRRQWLERVGKELDTADGWEAHHRPDALVKHLDHMVEVSSKTDLLSPVDRALVRDRVRITKLGIYERHVDYLLERAMTVTRDKERQTERGELLRQINDGLTIVVRLGASEAIRQSVKDRLDIIQQTSAAGASDKAKAAAEREAAMIDSAAHPKERRTFTRWRAPSIAVVIDGKRFDVVDWSLGGIMVSDIEDQGWKPGQQLEVKVGLSIDRLHAERIEVVRYSPEGKRLVIRSRRFASALMQLKRECDAAGIELSEARLASARGA
jgi:hypothetical protein